ncbi:ketosteroid isomerase-like protein [Mycolicibacterium chubuense NBB4]|uniref:Ketosteroid isomerase-like protein n=2 Tax=Mycolicibacterium chubuense TaxID=1800 RepID=I4BDL8_MYCCN|nr:ketosteroid isomerase-like protein [Mycolicibacterium chubuense NBB4]
MRALIDHHIEAEGRGDIDAALAVYTDDVDHDVVGFPNGQSRGREGARAFYEYLTSNFLAQTWTVRHQYVADDAIVLEQEMTGTVVGSMLGLAGHGRRITFRMLHVFAFRDGLISRENVWVDTVAVRDQLG